jgi:hypothetical protein
VQNKHSAPGICTLSGDALWKLYRATGTTRYLELLQDLAHNITQYLSRDDRPIGRMPAGWMNERVNLSDWAEGIGEIFHGSCWCEVSCMLTRVEVPGIYVQPDTGLLCVFDHIEVAMLRCTGGEITLRLTNPTRYPADVILFAEHSREMTTPLGPHALWGRPSVALLPGETREITLAADGLPQQDLVIREYR